jgi:hypothetical protein
MKKTVLALAALAAIINWGCQHGPPYDPIQPSSGRPPHQTTHGVSMLDKNVREAFLLVSQPEAKRLPLGQLQVVVTLQNRFPSDDLWAEAQFLFFDEGKAPVETSEWQNVHFGPLEVVPVNSTSLQAQVRSFNVQFRNLKSSTGRRLRSVGVVFEGGVWIPSILPN